MPVFTPHLLSSWFRPLRAGLALVLLTVPLAGFAQSTVRTDHGSAAAISIQLELAHQMQSAGRLQDAETMLGTLLEQTRANLGLFDPAQFAILEQLANTRTRQRNWSALLPLLAYYEWLANRVYGDAPLQLSDQLTRVAGVHEHAAMTTDGNQRSWHLIQARMLYWRAISSLQSVAGTEHLLPPLYYAIALGHYTINRHASQRWLTSFETRSDQPALISGWSLPGSERERRSEEIGVELMERIVAYYSRPGVTPELTAQVMALRGDWALIHGRSTESNHFYHQALELASTSSCPASLIGILFGRTQSLPVPSLTLLPDPCQPPGELLSEAPSVMQANWADSGLQRPFFTADARNPCIGENCHE
jgi:hypothetical protein